MPINTGTALLPRRQEQVVEGIITRKIRGLPFNGQVLPQDENLDIAAKYLSREFMDGRAEIAIASDDNDDVPFASVSVTEEQEGTALLLGAYRTTIDEYDAFQLASMNRQQATNVLQYRVETVNRAMEEKRHIIGAFGVPSMGIKGMLNSNFDLSVSTTNPHTLTFQDLLDWIDIQYGRRRRMTKLVEKPNLILLPESLDTKLSRTRSPNGDKSVMEVFLETNRRKGLMGIIPLNELESAELESNGVHASGTNRDRMMIYGLDKANLFRKISRKRQYPPEYRRRGYDNYVAQRVSGVSVNHEGSAEYVDYPKFA